MAIMKPKTATAALPSVTDYQKKLAESVAAYKPQLESYLASKSQYDAQKAAYDKNIASWQSEYDKYGRLISNLEGKNLTGLGEQTLQGYRNARASLEQQKPILTPFSGVLPTSPTGTKFADNALSYFNPTEYGVTGLQAELEKVRKDQASGSKIMKKPVYTFDVTQLEQNLGDMTALDLTKLGDFGGVMGQLAGAGTTGQVYVPKSALAKLSQAYKEYGLGDISQAVTSTPAWESATPPLKKMLKTPPGYYEALPERAAAKKAYEDALSTYNASKADWTAKTYDPYQSNLSKYQSQFTGQYVPGSSLLFNLVDYADPIKAQQIPGTNLYADWGVTQHNYQAPGAWYVNRGEKGYEKLNPASLGGWTKATTPGKNGWDLIQYYNPATFASDPGAAPVFSGVAPTSPEISTEHTYAPLATGAGGTGSSALGQLLRKTHGRTMGGIQNAGTEQALTQQLYGSGGLSTMGRLLSQGTNESLGGISNPMLRGMLSQQLYD